jgi:hypothetical protein
MRRRDMSVVVALAVIAATLLVMAALSWLTTV